MIKGRRHKYKSRDALEQNKKPLLSRLKSTLQACIPLRSNYNLCSNVKIGRQRPQLSTLFSCLSLSHYLAWQTIQKVS